MYFTAAGREKGEDPYYTHLYRVGLDGTGLKMLNPGDASHSAATVDSMKYFVDNSTRIDGAPESTLYDSLGQPADEAGDAGPRSADGGGLQVPRAVHGEGGRRRDRPLRRDVQAVRLRPGEEVPDHRLRLSRVRRPKA